MKKIMLALIGVLLFALTSIAAAATVQVNMQNFSFSPAAATINVGDTIRWVNQGGTHTSTSGGTNCVADGKWGSALLSTGQTFERTFTQAGTFPYFCSPHCSIGMTGTITVVQPVFGLTVTKSGSGAVTSSPAGINCGADCTESYNSGTAVTLTAAPSTGWAFSNWTGCDSSSGATCNVTMSADKTVSATFTQLKFTLTVSTSGSGAVTSSPAGINCGTDCTESYNSDAAVTLTATPATGWVFSGWTGCDSSSGATCNVTMSADKTVSATFTQLTFTLTVSVTGSGAVTSSPAGIDCGTDCTEIYNSGTAVTLTATPATDWAFSSWSGCDSNSGEICDVTISADKTVTATFTQPTPSLTIASILPAVGTTAGGCPVSATGTGFQTGATLSIGGTLAEQISVSSETLITGISPRGTAPEGSAPVPVSVIVTLDTQSSDHATDQVFFTYVHPGDIKDSQGVSGNHDGRVTIGEVQSVINMFLSGLDVKPEADSNCDGIIKINEVQQAINSFLTLP